MISTSSSFTYFFITYLQRATGSSRLITHTLILTNKHKGEK